MQEMAKMFLHLSSDEKQRLTWEREKLSLSVSLFQEPEKKCSGKI